MKPFRLFLEGKYISSKLQAEVVHLVNIRSEGQSREEGRPPGSFHHAVACTPAPAGRPADILELLRHSPLQGLGHRQAAPPEAGPEARGQMHPGSQFYMCCVLLESTGTLSSSREDYVVTLLCTNTPLNPQSLIS